MESERNLRGLLRGYDALETVMEVLRNSHLQDTQGAAVRAFSLFLALIHERALDGEMGEVLRRVFGYAEDVNIIFGVLLQDVWDEVDRFTTETEHPSGYYQLRAEAGLQRLIEKFVTESVPRGGGGHIQESEEYRFVQTLLDTTYGA